MKSRDFVAEAFDQPYPYEWDKPDPNSYHALAFLDDGSPLDIEFNRQGTGEWHVKFDRNYSMRVTGEGNQQRVFATVIAAMKEFVKKRKPQKVVFSALTNVAPGQKSTSRSSLYSSLISRFATALGYTAHIDDQDDHVVYELTKLATQPVTESSGTTAAGYTWRFEPGREVPMKPDVDANTFIRVKDPTGKTICGIWADVAGDSIEIEYSQVFDERLRGRGVYTDLLRSLSKQYTVISDTDNNNAATSIYKRLGADYDHRQATHTLRKQGVAEGLDQDVPPVLYHATYKPRLKSIKLKGLGAGGKRNWEDSQRGVVYLALDPNVAESYAETSDMVSDEWLDQIVILKISTAGLDSTKFQIDSNVQDNEGDTVEYHGVIPPSNISLYKQGVAEGKLNFEEGDCPIFAIALHRLSKMPLMALVEYDDQMGGTVLIHAYVKLDDRWRLDASGETDVDWMLQKYPNNGHAEEIEISEKDLLELGYGKSKCPTLQQVLPHAKEVLQNIEEGQQGVAEGSESAIQKIEKKIQAKRDALGLAREQRRMRGQHQQGQREIKLQAEIDRLSNELTQLKKQGVAEGFLNEGLAHPVIVVDVQPEYSGMNDGNESSVFPQIINFVNKQTGPVLMFVNAEDQGLSGDTIQDIKQYWDDTICPEEERYTHDEETDDYIETPNCPKINWQRFAIADKGYGYFRSWMDHGIEPATIVATIRELYQQKKSDSRELQFPAFNRRTPQQSLIMGAMEEMEGDPISVNWTSVSQLKRFNGAYIVGGARDQCLREVELLMNAFNIKYKRIDSLIYEGQQGVAEGEHAPSSLKTMVDVGGIQLNVAIDGAEVSIRPVVDGYQAGYVVFDRDGRTLVPDDLAIDDDFRGRGIAKIIYDYVKSLGFTIRRSSDQTRAGKHFWDKNRGEDGMIWEAGLIQQLVDIKNGPWILYESNRRVEIRKSHLFNQTLEDKAEKTPHLVAKIKEFVRFKSENPSRIIGKDTPLTNSPMAKTVPNIRHYHLTQDLSLFYTISGHDPVIIKLFGVFNHHESGTGDTRNINRQRSLAKQLGNQFDSADQPVAESSDDIESLDLMSAFKDFLPVAMRELDIKKLPPIKLLKQIPAGNQPTFGKFNKQDNVIHLGISERHPVDILRTLAHELVHYKQNTEHQLAAGSGATGSPEENQAHEVAGVIMRDFNRLHPEYFKSQAVNLSEGVEHNKETLDEILVNLCRHVVEGQRVDPDKYGMVAACVIDPDNRQVIGVNELTQDGTRRHGERVAMERYQAQYGAIPEGSIIVTTCSPCNEQHMDERYGESCTDLINASNCQTVYCGYQDPSQQDEHNEFALEVTGNSSIVDLCGQFAATFLNENFNDGKNPGRKGLSQRVGIPKNATIAQLERYKDAPGEKGRMARWQLNMRRGRNK